MIRRSTVIWSTAAIVVGTGLFLVKHQVQALEDRLTTLNRSITENREAIHVLNAEWSYLNRPERLERLGRKLLGYEPQQSAQLVRMDTLRESLTPVPATPTTATPASATKAKPRKPKRTAAMPKRPNIARAVAAIKKPRATATPESRRKDTAWVASIMAKLGSNPDAPKPGNRQ